MHETVWIQHLSISAVEQHELGAVVVQHRQQQHQHQPQQQVHHRRYENPGMRELTFLARKSGIFIMHHSPTMRPFRSLPLFSI